MRGPSNVLLVLDEIAALSRLESIAIGCNLLRGYGATMFMVAQSLSQLHFLYREAWTALASSAAATVCMKTTDKFTADYISAVAGVATEMIPSESATHHPPADGRAFAPQAVPLYSPRPARQCGARVVEGAERPGGVPFARLLADCLRARAPA